MVRDWTQGDEIISRRSRYSFLPSFLPFFLPAFLSFSFSVPPLYSKHTRDTPALQQRHVHSLYTRVGYTLKILDYCVAHDCVFSSPLTFKALGNIELFDSPDSFATKTRTSRDRELTNKKWKAANVTSPFFLLAFSSRSNGLVLVRLVCRSSFSPLPFVFSLIFFLLSFTSRGSSHGYIARRKRNPFYFKNLPRVSRDHVSFTLPSSWQKLPAEKENNEKKKNHKNRKCLDVNLLRSSS